MCVTDAENVGAGDNTEVSLASVIRDGLENANPSIAVFETMDNDGIFSQCLMDSGTTVTDVNCMPSNFLAGVNEISEEVGTNESNNSDLPVATEADGKDSSLHIETGCHAKQHQDTLMSGIYLGTGEAEKDQQLGELNAEDLVTAVSSVFSQSTDILLDDGMACNKPVEFSESGTFSSISQHGVNTTCTVSECTSEQNSGEDLIAAVDDDRSALSSKSPVPASDNDVMQVKMQSEQQGFTGVSSADSSVTDGNIAHAVDSSINSAESVDDVHCPSSSVHCNSEAENAAIQVLSKDKDSLQSNVGDVALVDDVAAVACSMKETLSAENCNIFPTNDVSGSMEMDDVYLELSPGTNNVVDNAVSDSPSHTSELVVQKECAIDKTALKLVEHSSCASELLNTASMVPDAASSQETAADSVQAVLLSCEEISAETSERCTTETDAANGDDANADLNSSLTCEVEVTNSTRSGSVKGEKHGQQSSDTVGVAPSKTGFSCENEPETDKEQSHVSVSAGALNCSEPDVNTDQSKELELLARNEACEEHSDSALEKDAVLGTTVSHVTNNEQVVLLSDTEERMPVCANATNKPDDISSKSGDLYKEGSEVTSEPADTTSNVAPVSAASLTVGSHVTEAVEPESRKESDPASYVIIVKDSATLKKPSNVSTPDSLSTGLLNIPQRTQSTAASLVTNSTGSLYQLPQYIVSSAMETHSTSTISYRPAAELAMNIGKNLVTEFVFREIVTHEAKWKNASDTEKVPVLVNNLHTLSNDFFEVVNVFVNCL